MGSKTTQRVVLTRWGLEGRSRGMDGQGDPPTSHCDSLVVIWSTLPSPIDSRWNPHIPHGLMESRWSPHGIKQFFSNVVASYGLQMDSMESRWSPGGIQLNFIKVIIVMLYIILQHISSWVWKSGLLPILVMLYITLKHFLSWVWKSGLLLIIVMLYIILQHFLSWVWKKWFIAN